MKLQGVAPSSFSGKSVTYLLRWYILDQSTSLRRYVLESIVFLSVSWIPTILGIGIRSFLYRLILKTYGPVAIEDGVRIRQPANVRLGRGVYLDHGVSLHGGYGGIEIGEFSQLMQHVELRVVNAGRSPNSGVWIGKNCYLGSFVIIRGHGGVRIGDHVLVGPNVQLLAVDHSFWQSSKPIGEQGLVGRGIVIENNVWIGAGAIVTDGIRIGEGSVVAAGALVAKDIPPYTLVAGEPARIVKRLEKVPE
jgi:acetyltransferase-like isoleucine patch superfamily enzyme